MLIKPWSLSGVLSLSKYVFLRRKCIEMNDLKGRIISLFVQNKEEKLPKVFRGKGIEFAFSSGNVKFYRFIDSENIPIQRSLAANSIYNELEMKCTREYLLLFCEKMQKLQTISLSKNNTNAAKAQMDMIQIVQDIKDRLSFVFEPDTMYKLGTVVYFTADDDIFSYSFTTASKYIELWKKEKMISFFLKKPLKELLPSTQASEIDIQTYLEEIVRISQAQMKRLIE